MKISYNWLLEYIDINLSAKEISDTLTHIGLEVEAVEYYSTLPKGIDSLVVGHIVELSQHPNADKLKLTKVDVGGPELLSIVCGAPNVAKGQKVIVAREGTVLHPFKGESFTIKKSKIRGEFSDGMLCADDEIGVGESHEGLHILPEDAEPGKPITPYLNGYTDWIIEIGLTPNRVDAASHIGVARDLAAYLGLKIKYPEAELSLHAHAESHIRIKIEDSQACPRYSGLVVKGITVKDSPQWMQNRLKAIGLNPINNIVDATNYVLHEYGHPLHAFDLSQIEGDEIIIKKAVPGTKFVTLDKQERTLDGTELVIANTEEPMALAGVFGGLKSGIQHDTLDIFIESAYFDPSTIRRAARRHQLFTDASFRFERGADPNITLTVLNRVAALIRDIAGGEPLAPVYDAYPQPISPITLRFNYGYLNAVAGMEIPVETVKNILQGLEFKIKTDDESSLLLEVPSFKTDVKRPIDVVEEVLRIYSIDKVPMPAQLKSIVQVDKGYHSGKMRQRISQYLIDQGFFEAYILSFVKEEDNRLFEERPTVQVLNPISADLAVVKNNIMIPGLRALQYNINRQRQDIKIFNWDNIHQAHEGKYKQEYRLGLWLTGNIQPENWNQKGRKTDFYYAKSLVMNILELAGLKDYEETEADARYLSYGLAFKGNNGKELASLGLIDNKTLKQADINQEVFYAEFDAKALLKARGAGLKFEAISKFPKVERDLALTVPETLNYTTIKNLIEKTDTKILKKVSIFDVYKGSQVGEGFKSYAIRLVFEDSSQTLEDKTVDKTMQRIVYRLQNELEVNIRA